MLQENSGLSYTLALHLPPGFPKLESAMNPGIFKQLRLIPDRTILMMRSALLASGAGTKF
jgi:hypothetical protein